jgi:predicted DNA-binding protein
MTVLTFRLEDEVKARLDAVVEQLGLNQSKILRDAVIARLEELEEMTVVMERIKANRPKRPIDELWKELGLDNQI